MPQFVGTADLAARWPYTLRGVQKLCNSAGFPKPLFTLNMGRVRVWAGVDVLAFENTHPEVTSPVEKRRKMIGYLRAVSKGREGEGEASGA